MILSSYALYQLTSSQQASPYFLPSQDLYALLWWSRSRSAQSVRPFVQSSSCNAWREGAEWNYCTWCQMLAIVFAYSHQEYDRELKGQTRLKLKCRQNQHDNFRKRNPYCVEWSSHPKIDRRVKMPPTFVTEFPITEWSSRNLRHFRVGQSWKNLLLPTS